MDPLCINIFIEKNNWNLHLLNFLPNNIVHGLKKLTIKKVSAVKIL